MNETDISRSAVSRMPLPMLHDKPGMSTARRGDAGEPFFTIRAADCEGHRSSAHILVNRMYAARGYVTGAMATNSSVDRITLVAEENDIAMGTITIGFDGPDRLLVDESFGDIARSFRKDGIVLCEFIKLAIDGVVRSKKVLASLMHSALLCARGIRNCDKVLIEVNPRHVRFYEVMLGFEILVNERHNARVDAPAVLMALDLAFAGDRIDELHKFGRKHARVGRSLYRHGFSPDEAAAVFERLHSSSAAWTAREAVERRQ